MEAGFSEFDITPPPGTAKAGWMAPLTGDRVLDPLRGRCAVFSDGRNRVAFIQLDILSIRWTHVDAIRRRITSEHGFPPERIMIACTHNHAGPATAGVHPVAREDAYNEDLTSKCTAAFGAALLHMQPVHVGSSSAFEFEVGFNRRTLFRDGVVRTQRGFDTPGALCCKGPVDPEVAVLAVRDADDQLLACLVNFACHPTHHGGTDEISAGFPGVLAARMKERGCPITLFLNGAYGNIHTVNFLAPKPEPVTMQEAGTRLADAVSRALGTMRYSDCDTVDGALETVAVDYRTITDDEYKGRAKGAQRFRSDELYEAYIDLLRKQIKAGKRTHAEVQVLRIGNLHFAGIPAEYFVEHGLRIKQASHPRHALVVGGANGMLGYLPTRQAFEHGGYETTLGPPSRMAPATGDVLADTAIRVIRSMNPESNRSTP